MALGVGVGNALNAPAWSAMLPTLVSRADLPGSISLNSTMINGSRVVGPIIVAVLSPLGVTTSQFFLLNAVTYLFVVFALLATRLGPPPKVHHEQGWRQFSAGLRLARDKPVVSRLLLSLTTFSFLVAVRGALPGCRRAQLRHRGEVVDLQVALRHLGPRRRPRRPRDRHRVRRVGQASADPARVRVVRRVPHRVRHRERAGEAFVAGFFLGISYFGTTTSMMTIVQSRLADHERGRVMSLWFMAFGGTVPLGNLVFGPVMDAVGANAGCCSAAHCGRCTWRSGAASRRSTPRWRPRRRPLS
ncbi:MAG: MFS transporter [Ilumatobacteraceae bacterium]